MARKILVVENHAEARKTLTFQLRSLGYEIIEATHGREAVEKAVAEKPNLIIMDLGLPGTSGIEATANIRNNRETANIPVVAYTEWVSHLYKENVLNAGVTAYVRKPVSPRLLIDVIERLC